MADAFKRAAQKFAGCKWWKCLENGGRMRGRDRQQARRSARRVVKQGDREEARGDD